MQDQKTLLPSPIFDVINQNQTKSSSNPVLNSIVKQVKCLASHKLYSSSSDGNPNPNTGRKNSFFHDRKNRNRILKPKFNGNHKFVIFDSKNGQWCEICDKKFHTVDQFNKHNLYEHKKCEINGCTFEAHPSIISKHIQEQHESGLYDKIRKLNTPEEIAKWRAERIKRYPTKTNIELRQRVQEEKMKRGEKLTERRSAFGDKRQRQNQNRKPIKNNKEKKQDVGDQEKSRKRKTRNSFRRKRKRSNGKKPKIAGNKMRKIENTQLNQNSINDIQEKEENFSDVEENSHEILRFKGTKNVTANAANYKESDEKDKNQNALTHLLKMYGSGSDDDESESEEREKSIDNPTSFVGSEDVKCNLELEEENISTDLNNFSVHSVPVDECIKSISAEDIPCKSITNELNFVQKCSDSEDDAPEEIPIVKGIANNMETELMNIKESPKKNGTSIAPMSMSTKENQKSIIKKQIKNGLNYSMLKYHKPRTLLEKLLEPDIRHERNILFQCVRFVVENRFFNIGCSRNADGTIH